MQEEGRAEEGVCVCVCVCYHGDNYKTIVNTLQLNRKHAEGSCSFSRE